MKSKSYEEACRKLKEKQDREWEERHREWERSGYGSWNDGFHFRMDDPIWRDDPPIFESVERPKRARKRHRPGCLVILGLASDATIDQVKAAYRKLAMRHHPDKGGDAIAFRVVHDAYTEAMRLLSMVS